MRDEEKNNGTEENRRILFWFGRSAQCTRWTIVHSLTCTHRHTHTQTDVLARCGPWCNRTPGRIGELVVHLLFWLREQRSLIYCSGRVWRYRCHRFFRQKLIGCDAWCARQPYSTSMCNGMKHFSFLESTRTLSLPRTHLALSNTITKLETEGPMQKVCVCVCAWRIEEVDERGKRYQLRTVDHNKYVEKKKKKNTTRNEAEMKCVFSMNFESLKTRSLHFSYCVHCLCVISTCFVRMQKLEFNHIIIVGIVVVNAGSRNNKDNRFLLFSCMFRMQYVKWTEKA